MNGLNFINFKIIKMPVKFTACEGGYIATDGTRMCKVTFEERFRIERIKSRIGPESAYLEFLEIFRGGREMEKIVQSLIDFQIGILNNIGVRGEQYIQCVKELDKIKKILGIKQSYYMEQLNKELLGNREWNE